MNSLKIFQNENFGQVRVIDQDGEPWFIAKDVCDILEINNSRQALTRLDDDEKNSVILNDGIGNPNMSAVNEYGLYSLVLSSRKEEAKQFKRWITHDVIPSIRKHGLYATDELLNNPDLLISLAQELKDERALRNEMQSKIETDRPKVLFADSVSASKTSILVGELAKLLRQNGVEIGQNRLFEKLRSEGYLIRRKGTDWNMPTQYSMDLELFEIKEHSHLDSNGNNITTKTAKVTGKGQIYFINKFIQQAS